MIRSNLYNFIFLINQIISLDFSGSLISVLFPFRLYFMSRKGIRKIMDILCITMDYLLMLTDHLRMSTHHFHVSIHHLRMSMDHLRMLIVHSHKLIIPNRIFVVQC